MPDAIPPLGISVEDWAATPVAVRVLVMELLQRVVKLEARLKQTSQNSSKPPSSDPPSTKLRAAKEPTGRKLGGQPGHEGHGRKLKPESEVDQIVDVRPEQCGQCGTLLLGDDEDPERHQVTDFPRITPVVTEYRRHCLRCVACGARTQAPWPVTMPSGSFGPRVQATVGYLTGRMGASQREVQEILATLCQTEVSVGSIATLEHAVSAALAAPVAEAEQYVQRQPVRNADETSWREKTKLRWLWISVTSVVTLFRLLRTRGAAGAKELLGEAVWGIIGTDHYAGYHWIDPRQRQRCWAHLKREFVAWSAGSSLACPQYHHLQRDQAHSRRISAITAPQTPRGRPPAPGDCAGQALTGTWRAALLGTCARARATRRHAPSEVSRQRIHQGRRGLSARCSIEHFSSTLHEKCWAGEQARV